MAVDAANGKESPWRELYSVNRQKFLGGTWDWLKENQAGLIALDGGRMGWTERYVRAGNRQAAVRYASRLGGLFGERGYLSLELHGPADTAVARELVTIGDTIERWSCRK